jgi:hypothetical protein
MALPPGSIAQMKTRRGSRKTARALVCPLAAQIYNQRKHVEKSALTSVARTLACFGRSSSLTIVLQTACAIPPLGNVCIDSCTPKRTSAQQLHRLVSWRRCAVVRICTCRRRRRRRRFRDRRHRDVRRSCCGCCGCNLNHGLSGRRSLRWRIKKWVLIVNWWWTGESRMVDRVGRCRRCSSIGSELEEIVHGHGGCCCWWCSNRST